MPKARKKKVAATPEDVDVSHFRSYSEITALGAADLNRLCKAKQINTAYSKSAKVNLLCMVLNISTCGKENVAPPAPRAALSNLSLAQEREFQSLTPNMLAVLPGWTKELHNIPDVDDTIVKKYLKDTSVLTPEMTRTYKISRPYQLKQFVHSMRHHPLPDQHPVRM